MIINITFIILNKYEKKGNIIFNPYISYYLVNV